MPIGKGMAVKKAGTGRCKKCKVCLCINNLATATFESLDRLD